MRIGIDFDNTLVDYDALFHKVACEWECVPRTTPPKKLAVRDHLRAIGEEDRWTELQGYVYGARMDEAEPYPGAIEFLRAAREAGHKFAIISHKTLHPFRGPAYDLHAAARGWVERRVGALVPSVFFEPTKEAKLARIAAFACDAFVDDLPEILLDPAFPPSVALRLLFDPDRRHAAPPDPRVRLLHAWSDAAAHFDR